MANINWPSGATTGDTYTSPDGDTWIWTGYAWDANGAPSFGPNTTTVATLSCVGSGINRVNGDDGGAGATTASYAVSENYAGYPRGWQVPPIKDNFYIAGGAIGISSLWLQQGIQLPLVDSKQYNNLNLRGTFGLIINNWNTGVAPDLYIAYGTIPSCPTTLTTQFNWTGVFTIGMTGSGPGDASYWTGCIDEIIPGPLQNDEAIILGYQVNNSLGGVNASNNAHSFSWTLYGDTETF